MHKKILFSFIALGFIFVVGPSALISQQPSGPSHGASPGILTGTQENKPGHAKDAVAKPNEPQLNVIEGYLSKDLWREGSKVINMIGRFQTTGEGVQFTSGDGKLTLTVVENLMAERVYQTVTDSADVKDRDWMIQGTITEYRGSNFIILSHAILRGKSAEKDSGKTDSKFLSKQRQNPIP